MNPFLRNTLAVTVGIIIGSLINMSIILISSSIIPLPEGADNRTIQGLQKTIHLFEAKHFLFPFLAHAAGTFAGAVTTALLAVNHKKKLALAIGAFFLFGGIISVSSLPSPTWFTLIDLVFAYIPMAYLALKLVCRKQLKFEY
ncbi:hypothetical protein [Flavobacterium johnsoniae]|uniref:Uncharacterized protein n=1 Tax=Flavobacterium johnsoniae (strain ATCC 17061 / DSM 2064 / JCM 8514 / BCRC 14874 / CCUG 350202 / NBRC 14942 / NCIMB 11054 / UW101) TaxID=376686 RepID=A5FAS4_FLAJ1|nr:hypothetical protein [Flavobacterium johnsoniae]ABQ07692.1 hypothetical protein Fjoh_4693 [Flavobacterium johnsoniae UW101]OXG01776.1 hypothetical protein B0A63_03715 [Flavobacterium johnsoniae UW101]WQG80469.1 hypothetical protein SR927_20905 [Flavobacterium johnsoniae UW101]SHL05213.1 hypothetical protein SAMN05444146_2788 [Flavobacterium johnsoniae]